MLLGLVVRTGGIRGGGGGDLRTGVGVRFSLSNCTKMMRFLNPAFVIGKIAAVNTSPYEKPRNSSPSSSAGVRIISHAASKARVSKLLHLGSSPTRYLAPPGIWPHPWSYESRGAKCIILCFIKNKNKKTPPKKYNDYKNK